MPRNVKGMIPSIHSTCSVPLLGARHLGKWPTSHPSLLKSKTALCHHTWLAAHWLSWFFPLLFSERQMKRKMNKLWFAMDSRKNILEVASGLPTDSAKSVCLSLEPARGGERHSQAVIKLWFAVSAICSENSWLMRDLIQRIFTEYLLCVDDIPGGGGSAANQSPPTDSTYILLQE